MSSITSCTHDWLVEFAWQDQAEQERDDVQQEMAVQQADWSKTLEQAERSHKSEVQDLQRQLHDGTAAEGELTRNSALWSLQW